MTAQFRLTQPAIQDIEEIADRLAQQSSSTVQLRKFREFFKCIRI